MPRPNAADLTLRNLHAGKVKLAGLNTAVALIRKRVGRLEAIVRELERRVTQKVEPGR